MDAVLDYLPSPLDIPAIKGIDPKTDEEVERPADDSAPFSALAFKVMTDPFVGRLTFFRVYSGVLQSGSYVQNATKANVNVLVVSYRCMPTRSEISEVYAGDIAAAVGLKDTTTGDTLCDEKSLVILESMEFPEPVIKSLLNLNQKLTKIKWVWLYKTI